MASSFETSLTLNQTSPTTFTNTHPPWTWPNTPVVPGGLLLSFAASAAISTLPTPSSFHLTNAQIHFLSSPTSSLPITLSVTTISNGRRFQVRSVSITQSSKPMCHVTLTFMTSGAWRGKAMTHCTPRQTAATVDNLTLDDLSVQRGKHGPFMAFQRLPLVHSSPRTPSTTIAPIACQIVPPITSTDPHIHMIGILSLSDYHVLDFPPTVHDIPFGLAAIGAPLDQRRPSDFKLFTSLNHTIHFHVHEGFRADELTYVEVTSPWAKDGRAVMHTKIFSKAGLLIATCVQEAYYVLKEDANSGIGSKL